MDNDSLSALEKLKQLKSIKKTEKGLDPNIFFNQITPKVIEKPQASSDDELFGAPAQTMEDSSGGSSNITEDDLFGGQTVNIIPSSNFEAIVEKKEDKIAELEKAIANTKIEEQGEKKVEALVDTRTHTMVNGVKKYQLKEEDKPEKKVSVATKAVKKAPHNQKELDDVDLLEKVLISIMLNNIKK